MVDYGSFRDYPRAQEPLLRRRRWWGSIARDGCLVLGWATSCAYPGLRQRPRTTNRMVRALGMALPARRGALPDAWGTVPRRF